MKLMKNILAAALICAATFGVSAENHVVIDKPNLVIYVINEASDTVFRAPCCCGRNLGQKTRVGDCKTPEGTFEIYQIQNASSWTHDFGDGAGERKGAYGPYFFRLRVPNNNSIGIHGTCFPERISTRDSEGCIRLLNSDLLEFRKHVHLGTPVTILPDPA